MGGATDDHCARLTSQEVWHKVIPRWSPYQLSKQTKLVELKRNAIFLKCRLYSQVLDRFVLGSCSIFTVYFCDLCSFYITT